MNNVQSFSQNSEEYARHRPQYPDELYSFLSEITEGHDSAWDCATGNGQAAVSCANYFSRVEATDISAEQIQHCIQHPKVHYSVSPAEKTPFADQSFDLIMVAQAIHWFDREKFFQETDRLLKPGGVLAAWGYGWFEVEPEIDAIIAQTLLKPIDRFWAEGNRIIMNGYRDITLPYDDVQILHRFTMQIQWDLNQLTAYLRTWSAVKRHIAELGSDPVTQMENALKTKWQPDAPKLVCMPIFLKVGKRPA